MDIFDTYKTFAMIGKPGSGKGTQAHFLAEKLGCKIFSSGDTFRAITKEDNFLGRKTADIIDNGGLMPYWLSAYLFQDAVIRLPKEEGIIFEGSARKKPEAELFHDVMTWLERPYKAILIEASDEEVTQRQLARGKETGRLDNSSPERIQVRLDLFEKEIAPSIEFFESKGALIRVNGEQAPEAVFEETLEKLSKLA